MKKCLILLILFLFISLPTRAVTWIKIADNEYIDKDNIKTYIDDNNKKHDCALNWNSIAPNTNSALLYNIVQNRQI